jgi:CRP/FNR family nitrogen fixation transcriptional regulator
MPAKPLAVGDRNPSRFGAPDREAPAFIGVARTLSRDQEVFAQGAACDVIYKVISGAVRTFRLLADGRRQIIGFHLPGDVFGFEANALRATSAEAVCDSVLASARRSTLIEDEEQRGRLSRCALAELLRAQDLLLTLGRRSALERVASFLIDLDARTGGADLLALPMSRQDIADHLGLTIETVSRTFTEMQARGLVRFQNARQIQLLRRSALVHLCD